MQLPDFKQSEARWDQYRCFHIMHAHNFVQFDTGELIATRWYVRDRYYENRNALGLTVLASDDISRNFTNRRVLKTPDGDKIMKSWFPSGRGYIFDESAAMLIKTGDTSKLTNIPKRFRGMAAAYWPGSNCEPIGAPLTLTKPRQRTPEEKEKAEELRVLAKAWRKLTDEGKGWSNVYGSDGVALDTMMDKDFEALPDHVKARLADNGVSGPWETITLPYVKVEAI